MGDERSHGQFFGDLLRLVCCRFGFGVVVAGEGDCGAEGQEVGLGAALALSFGVVQGERDGLFGAIEIVFGEPGGGDDMELHAAEDRGVGGVLDVD